MLKNGWNIAITSILLLGWCCPGSAESNARFAVDIFNASKRLPDSVVLSVIQARDGYLWLGTLEGLARFDGVDFTIFDENNTPGLKSRRIVSLYEDSRTNLWVGTERNGVKLIKDGKVIEVGVGQMRSACEDTNGAVWFYTEEGQLCRYRDKQVSVWPAGTTYSRYRGLIAEESDLLWLGTDGNLTALGPIPNGPTPGLPVAYESSTNELHKLDLILASKRGGHWRLADFRIQRWHKNKKECDWPYPTGLNVPWTACEDLEGNLVVGTFGNGLFWFDADGHATRISSEQGLSHNTVLSVIVDREGVLWAGTNGGGLNRVKKKFFGLLESSQGKTTQSICEDSQGGLWIGYNGDRVDYLREGLSEPPIPVNQDSYVKAVFVDRDQRVWVGSWNPGGLFQFQNRRFLRFRPPLGYLNVSAVYQDRKGVIWAGTQNGLFRLDNSAAFTTRNGLSANDVRAITDDSEGNLWVGTEGGGVNLLHEGKFTHFNRSHGLPSDDIRSLYTDSSGVLWAGTSSGLARYAGGRWTAYSRKDGLPSTSLSYLVEDSEGYMWIGSKSGLLRINKKDLNDFADGKLPHIYSRAYGEAEGLPADECTSGSQPGAIRARDGRLWFPTIRGLAYLDRAQLKLNTNPPPVLIEAVLIDGVLQNTNTLRIRSPLDVNVPPGKESLDIKYTSLNLAAPEKGRFKYRLSPHEKTWQEAPWNLRTAHYPRLPPGDYQFQVIACNEDDVWNQKGSALAVTVLPAFWQTWWFRALVGIGLIGIIAASVYYVSTQKLQRQLATLRQQEALEKERSRIARDLHDELGANLTQVALLGELAESDKDSPREVEAHARQISQTARETTHALDEIVWTVNPSNDTLDGLINYVCKYAQEYLAVAGLKYRLDVPAQLPGTPISPELRHNVFLASKEAITNIVRHAKATSGCIRLRLEPDSFALEIEDNGQGLNPNQKSDRSGLRNMRKRMEDIGGQFEISPGSEGGTKVRLSAPIRNTKT